MRKVVFVIAMAAVAACGGDKDEGAAGSGKPVEGKAAAIDYSAIDNKVASAKTSDDFLDILTACGGLEIDHAASGKGELAKDPTYKQHCKVAPTVARANLAIAESTPDKMSVHCLAASMGVEELIDEGVQPDELRPLLARVNEACGM